jgi:hypothetical protein
MLHVLGKNEMLVEALQYTPGTKPVSAFCSQAQSATCYSQFHVGVHREASIGDLKLDEFLRCALQ